MEGKQPAQELQPDPERAPSSSDIGSSLDFEKISLHSGRSSPDAEPGAPPAAERQPSSVTPAPAPTSTEQPASSSVKSPSSSTRGAMGADPLKELEEAAAVAQQAAQQAAQKVMKAGAEAKKEISSFVSSLWSAFDSPGAAAKKEQGNDEELRARLGLGPGQSVLESFRCKLIQSYAPAGNSFTGPKNIAFSGHLHIATAAVCFELDGAAAPVVRVPAASIASFAREGDAIELRLDGPEGATSMVVGAFALPALEVDSALALLECLTSPEAPPPPAQQRRVTDLDGS
jgi:hypothetical protein